MQRTFTLLLLFAILLISNSYSTTNGKLLKNKANYVTRINVRTAPFDSSPKSTKDKSQIIEILDYINGLDLKKTTKDELQYYGMAYVITIYYGDSTSKEYVHFGNTLFCESGKDWYEMPYEQAEKFNGIYKRLSNK